MIYNKDRGWYFVHVPKNAGTAIEYPFTQQGNPNGYIQERELHGIQTINPKPQTHHNKASFWQWAEFTNGLSPVALLRNPFSRCLSLYLYNLKNCENHISEEWAKNGHSRLIKEGFKGSWMDGGFFVDGHGKNVEYNEDSGRGWSQSDDQFSWLEGVDGARWFRIEDQLQEFSDFTGLPILTEKINTTTKADHQLYYDKELKEQIFDIFFRDFELGGYDF